MILQNVGNHSPKDTASHHRTYEVVSKIFWTGATIYTAVLVVQSTRPNCEFWVLLGHFVATAWKRVKMSPWTLVRTDLAASSWQCPVSDFCPHPSVSGETKSGCHPPPNVLPWFGALWLLPISKNETEAERRRFDTIVEIQTESQRVLDTDRKGLPGSVPKTEGQVFTCERELLRGWWRPIGFMVSFMNFTSSVRNILDTPSYVKLSLCSDMPRKVRFSRGVGPYITPITRGNGWSSSQIYRSRRGNGSH
jgi:hypothetical protein